MKKSILEQYSDSKARVKYLTQSVDKLEQRIELMKKEGQEVTDVVTCGKKGKRTLGIVKITGVPLPEYERLFRILESRKACLQKEEQDLLELTGRVEEYIAGIENVEIRNILSLYYVDDLNWIQVSHRMNGLYQKRKAYTDSSCRCKHDRFIEKVLKATVTTERQC